jgi:hypothetical protein
MTLNQPTLDFLLKLLKLGLVLGDRKQAIEWASSNYEQGLYFPPHVDSLLTSFCSTHEQSVLWDLALILVEGFYCEVNERTKLVALMVIEGKVDQDKAAKLLNFYGVNTDALTPSIRRVADVLWLLKQDSDLGVMEPSSDNLLYEALTNVAMEIKTNVE